MLPGAVSLATVQKMFDEKGTLVDESATAALHVLAGSLLEFMDVFVRPTTTVEASVREAGSRCWTTVI